MFTASLESVVEVQELFWPTLSNQEEKMSYQQTLLSDRRVLDLSDDEWVL